LLVSAAADEKRAFYQQGRYKGKEKREKDYTLSLASLPLYLVPAFMDEA
jgi:hypothetical protein